MNERRSGSAILALVLVLTSAVSYYAGSRNLIPQVSNFIPKAGQTGHAATSNLDVKRLEEVRRAIQNQYVETVTEDKLLEGALKGMVQATGDRYSFYYNQEEYARFLEHFEPTFSGIGVHVEQSPHTGYVTVVAPIKGSPGERAGLRAGDAIIGVGGQDISRMSVDQAVKLIRGPKGEPVTLRVLREGQPPFEVEIVRATITIETVEYRMVDDEVGYIWLKEFNKQSGQRVGQAIEELKAQGMKRLVFDLRLNPGGLLDEAVNVASHFIGPNLPVVHVVERGGGKQTYSSNRTPALNMPTVVLINQGSASASEIVAGAIKDHNAGFIMGTKTFGKGSVQSFFGFNDGAGMKITTARYLTAGEHPIDGLGLEPHREVTQPEVEDTRQTMPGGAADLQLEEAIRHVKTLQ